MADHKRPADGRIEIPDLDIPAGGNRAAAPRAAQKASAAPRTKAAPPAQEPADPLDFFGGAAAFDAGSGGELALDSEKPGGGVSGNDAAGYFGSASLDGEDGFDSGLGGGFDLQRSDAAAVQSAKTASRPKPTRPWPTGVSPIPGAQTIDRGLLASLAGYGAPPATPALSPLYTIRVLTKKRALTARVGQIQAEVKKRERARDGLLATLAENLLSELQRGGYTDLLDTLAEADRLIDERRAALTGTNADYDQQAKNLATSLTENDRRKQEALATEGSRRKDVEARKLEFTRADAKQKRCFIELRPFADLVEKGQALNPAQAARVKELEAQAAGIAQELSAARDRLKSAEQALAKVERELEGLARERAEAERKRRALEDQFRKQIGARSAELDDVEGKRTDALADAGRRVLAERGQIPVNDAALDRLLEADQSVAQVASDLDRHLGALEAYDTDAFKRGIVIAGAAILAVVLLVVLLIAF